MDFYHVFNLKMTKKNQFFKSEKYIRTILKRSVVELVLKVVEYLTLILHLKTKLISILGNIGFFEKKNFRRTLNKWKIETKRMLRVCKV